MPRERDCVVKLVDDHDVEHSVRVRVESVYEVALRGLQQLEEVGWESDDTQIGFVTQESHCHVDLIPRRQGDV